MNSFLQGDTLKQKLDALVSPRMRAARSVRVAGVMQRQYFGGPFSTCGVVEVAFDRSLARYLRDVVPELAAWFGRLRTLDDIRNELEAQIASPLLAYRMHHPRQEYVLAFVTAAKAALGKGSISNPP